MRAAVGTRYGWLLLVLAGCEGMLPPPPPPRFRTAAPTTTPATPPDTKPGGPAAPRGPNSAPEHFKVKLETSKGDIVIDVHRHMAPLGADRFHQLVQEGFYDGCKFFRVVMERDLKIVQFGMHGDPKVNAKYQENKIPDDPRTHSNVRGTISFATSGPNSRTSQLFLNLGDNSRSLDGQGFAPFGHVVEGLEDVVDKLTGEYGQSPDQRSIGEVGNTYLDERFPNLDFIVKATIVDGKSAEKSKTADDAPQSETPPQQEKPDAKPDSDPKPDGDQ